MISTASGWGWEPTRSAGPPTATRRSRCSTRTSTRAAASSTPPTPTGGRASSAPPRRSSASGSRPAAAATTSSSPRRSARSPAVPGSRRANITAAVDESLRRLQTDRIDLYWAHKDDPDTPQEETLAAFDGLVRAGKVRDDRGVQLLGGPARVGAGDLREGGPGRLRRAAAALQPHGAGRVRDHAAAGARRARPHLRALLRAGPRLPHREVPAGRRGRQPARRRARRPTSTSAGSPCSPCSTTWRRRTAWRRRPSRWPGSPRSPRWRRRWPARGRSDQLADLLPTLSLDAHRRGGGGAVGGVAP